MKNEEKETKAKGEAFFRDFFALPYDNPMTAAEKERMIRESHYFDPDRELILHLGKNPSRS